MGGWVGVSRAGPPSRAGGPVTGFGPKRQFFFQKKHLDGFCRPATPGLGVFGTPSPPGGPKKKPKCNSGGNWWESILSIRLAWHIIPHVRWWRSCRKVWGRMLHTIPRLKTSAKLAQSVKKKTDVCSITTGILSPDRLPTDKGNYFSEPEHKETLDSSDQE